MRSRNRETHGEGMGRPAGVTAAEPDADRARVERARRGDVRAARELYDAHAPRVYRIACRFAGDAARAEEVVQDTFVRAFQRLGDFRGEAFGAWLRSIAVSVSLNALRTLRRRAAREVALADVDEPASHPVEPRDVERVHAAIDALPERARGVFVLHALEGYSHAEVAAMLGISEANSKVILLRARARLREELHDLGEEWKG
ncbi:MAG TPA: sigma-70 family RNA polymerase sigma factor [Longimicrobium sp.]|nr:sigma-70 family RNA polymerase sigma factor [Longimicrobium sp.]